MLESLSSPSHPKGIKG